MKSETFTELPELLTVKKAAEFLGVGVHWVRKMGRLGRLKMILINERGDRRFPKDDVLRLYNERKFEYVSLDPATR